MDIDSQRTQGAPLVPRMLNHLARVTHDSQRTVEFYTKVLGMELASSVLDDSIPSTGDAFPYLHLFFRMADGSTLAFFESPGLPPRAEPTHPAYDIFDHIALQVASVEELDRWHAHLQAMDVEVLGPVDHGIILSLYFHDPNGYRLELTVPLDEKWNYHGEQGHADVKLWTQTKQAAIAQNKDVAGELVRVIKAERSRGKAKTQAQAGPVVPTFPQTLAK